MYALLGEATSTAPATISPDLGARITASVLVNHDTVPELVSLAAAQACESGQTITLARFRVELAKYGFAFDAEGWML